MDLPTIVELRDSYRDGLLNDVLPFWLRFGVDNVYGGIMASVDCDGSILDTDKSVWQQGRFTWLLGELYNHPFCSNHPHRQKWLEIALQNTEFMLAHCVDPLDGRMWFHVTREGKPIRKRRYAFSESFAAIAYGEVAQATGDSSHAARARDCLDRFVDHNLNPKGVTPKFTDVRPTKGIGFPMILINTAQQLRSSIGLDTAEKWIDQSIAEIQRDFCKPELECVMETVGRGGELIEHFDGRTLNPGHAIEGAWFIMSEGQFRNDDRLVQMGCQMLDWMWKRGWDKEFGGLLYFVSVDGRPIQEYWHDMKFWWPHNETIIATLMAYSLTGDAKYLKWHRQIHDWTHEHFPDKDHGEWFGYLRRDGQVSSRVKGNLWKGPFHIPRMQLVCWEILEEMFTKT